MENNGEGSCRLRWEVSSKQDTISKTNKSSSKIVQPRAKIIFTPLAEFSVQRESLLVVYKKFTNGFVKPPDRSGMLHTRKWERLTITWESSHTTIHYLIISNAGKDAEEDCRQVVGNRAPEKHRHTSRHCNKLHSRIQYCSSTLSSPATSFWGWIPHAYSNQVNHHQYPTCKNWHKLKWKSWNWRKITQCCQGDRKHPQVHWRSGTGEKYIGWSIVTGSPKPPSMSHSR